LVDGEGTVELGEENDLNYEEITIETSE